MVPFKKIGLFSLLFLTQVSFASKPPSLVKNFEISIAGGSNWMNANRSTSLIVTSYENDSVFVNRVTKNALWKIGAGYHVLSNKRIFFNDLLMELNFYQAATSIKGNVWQYQLPQFNNYQFTAPLTSSRLMLDIKPNLFTWHHISPYIILGAGIAWNNVSYNESISSLAVDPASCALLKKRTTTNTVYDLGAGVRVDVTKHLSLSLEYLYTDLGKLSPSSVSKNSVTIATPPAFSIRSQAILLGVNLKF